MDGIFVDNAHIVVNSDDDNYSSDDNSPYGEDIDYIDAIPPDAEIVSLEVVEIVDPEVGRINDDILLTIKDDIINRSDFYHEEFADEFAHIMSLPNLECFKFKVDPDPRDLISIDLGIRKNVSTTNVNVPLEDDQSSLFRDCLDCEGSRVLSFVYIRSLELQILLFNLGIPIILI
ncbi:hypothetical protein Tco_0932955 [Tanacetum coccineum]|uniref:Reverse transcriptase domain-containing protein n=1 Tax=Tanacetum coccineum TaxID=301880 RepID=A0ABQ5CDK0_9ASTR